MDGLNADYNNLGKLLLGITLCLLAFGWSAIFWYAARMLSRLDNSVGKIDVSIAKLFERLGSQSEDIKSIDRRIIQLERRK